MPVLTPYKKKMLELKIKQDKKARFNQKYFDWDKMDQFHNIHNGTDMNSGAVSIT